MTNVALDRHPGDRSARREYDPEEVDALTQRASELLDQLHEVMAEMSARLRTFSGDEDDSP